MKLDRRSFLAAAAATLAAPAAFAQSAAPKQKFTVILDWFVNPDHAPLFTARYIGAFDRAGLDVALVPPTDPDLPPRLLAAGKADAALSYQTQLYLLVDQGLPRAPHRHADQQAAEHAHRAEAQRHHEARPISRAGRSAIRSPAWKRR